MFRITKAFQNDSTQILRIEGKITEEILPEWENEMKAAAISNGQHLILDFAKVWFITPKAVEVITQILTERVYVLNCGMEMRNALHASGLSSKILE